MLCAHLANIAPRDEKDRRKYEPREFMPQWDQGPSEPDPATLRDKALAIFGAIRDARAKRKADRGDR